jgi:hypothetical protein
LYGHLHQLTRACVFMHACGCARLHIRGVTPKPLSSETETWREIYFSTWRQDTSSAPITVPEPAQHGQGRRDLDKLASQACRGITHTKLTVSHTQSSCQTSKSSIPDDGARPYIEAQWLALRGPRTPPIPSCRAFKAVYFMSHLNTHCEIRVHYMLYNRKRQKQNSNRDHHWHCGFIHGPRCCLSQAEPGHVYYVPLSMLLLSPPLRIYRCHCRLCSRRSTLHTSRAHTSSCEITRAHSMSLHKFCTARSTGMIWFTQTQSTSTASANIG